MHYKKYFLIKPFILKIIEYIKNIYREIYLWLRVYICAWWRYTRLYVSINWFTSHSDVNRL